MDRLLEATYLAEQRHFWFRGFRQFVTVFVERAVAGRRLPRILDCGCGTGANLELLAHYGRVFGFDLTWRGLAFARRHGRPRLAQASITDLPFADAQFDLVTSFDVIQSLTREQAGRAVAEMHRVMRPGGALVLNVAALELLRGNHSVLAHEQHRYTRAMLARAVERAGFRIERVTYTNASIFPLVLGQRVLQRWRGLASAEEAEQQFVAPPAPINAVLSGVLALEARVLRHVDLPIGSSILCLARKAAPAN